MSELSPREATNLANMVYDVKNERDWNDSLPAIITNPSISGFTQTPTRLVGQSGWGQSSGFAYIADGAEARGGETVVAIRGTASLAD